MITQTRAGGSSTDWRPFVCFGLLGLAQLGVFWFSAYRILTGTFLGLTALLLLWGPTRGHSTPEARRVLWSFLAVYAYMALSTFWAPKPWDALGEVAKACIAAGPPLLLGWCLGRRSTLDGIAAGVVMLPLVLAIQALYGLASTGDAMRIGDFNIRTHVAGLICLSAPVLLARALAARSVLTWLGLTLCFGLVLVNESRSSILIVLPALLYVIKGYSPRFFRATAVLVAVAFLVGAAVFASGGSIGRFSAEGSSFELSEALIDELAVGNSEEVDLERRVHAVIAASLFINNPVFGAGYASVLQTFGAQLDLDVPAHGFIPGMLGELGMVGMALIGVFVWRNLQLLRKDRQSRPYEQRFINRGFVAGFGALVAYGEFHQTFEWAYFPMMVGLMIGATVRARRTHKQGAST